MRKNSGLALPLTLLFTVVLSIISGALALMASRHIQIDLSAVTAQQTLLGAEGVLNRSVGTLAANPRGYLAMIPLGERPNQYLSYSPASFVSTYGIPDCSSLGPSARQGPDCHRHLYPSSGGLIKNNGEITGSGVAVSTSALITEQLSALSPPPDYEFNFTKGESVKSWYQFERLDEELNAISLIGSNLANDSSDERPVRFRISATASKSIGSKAGESKIVSIVRVYP
jgi:hypothetical protein